MTRTATGSRKRSAQSGASWGGRAGDPTDSGCSEQLTEERSPVNGPIRRRTSGHRVVVDAGSHFGIGPLFGLHCWVCVAHGFGLGQGASVNRGTGDGSSRTYLTAIQDRHLVPSSFSSAASVKLYRRLTALLSPALSSLRGRRGRNHPQLRDAPSSLRRKSFVFWWATLKTSSAYDGNNL